MHAWEEIVLVKDPIQQRNKMDNLLGVYIWSLLQPKGKVLLFIDESPDVLTVLKRSSYANPIMLVSY